MLSARGMASIVTRSAYKFINHTPYVQDNLSRLWEIKAPPRVQVFLWMMMRNKLLTIDNMIRRGWMMPNMCYLCRMHIEISQHVFNDCSFTRQLRDYIAHVVPSTKGTCEAFTSLISTADIIGSQYAQYWKQLEVTTIFTIWNERCRRIFDNRAQQIPAMTIEIFREYKLWYSYRETDTQ
jgi:zinc-binding in reverse transcriptase